MRFHPRWQHDKQPLLARQSPNQFNAAGWKCYILCKSLASDFFHRIRGK